MDKLAIGFAVAFIVSALSGLFLVPMLQRFKMKQQILEIGPKWHMSKQGTPMMGGLMFIIGTIVASVLLGIQSQQREWLLILVFALLNSAIGLIDDLAKVKRKQNRGLSVLQKLFLQLAFSAAFITALYWMNLMESGVYIPFTNITLILPWVLFLLLAILYNTFIVNAVNLTDGVDGLCTGVTIPIALFFVLVAVSRGTPDMAIFPVALAGGLLGFLLYNFNPAKVFMGDTGSLFLGGAVCGMAKAFEMPLILIVVAVAYIIEALSVVIQVSYFKASGGKRVFKMTPIHHHFEMSGWSEKKLFFVFTLGTVLLCTIAYIWAI